MHLLNDATKSKPIQSAGRWRESIAQAGAFVCSQKQRLSRWTATELAGERLVLGFDDDRVYSEFAPMLGATRPAADYDRTDATVVVETLTRTNVAGFGYFRVTRLGRPVPALDYFIGYGRRDCPYREIGRLDGWTAISEDDVDALFLIREEHCFFRLNDDWPIIALSLLFRAAFGVQQDAILFHAAAVIIGDKGFIFAGPRYAGKSTISLALAARGHSFLSDEIAWYVPSTRALIDFRRPVGLREGVRAAAVDARFPSVAATGIEWHDSLRLPVDALLPQAPPATATLDVIVFLKPFAATPRLIPLQPSLDHLPLLQPIPISMLNVSPARRMMEMVRLISSVRMYDLYPGHPDETAKILEEIACP